MDIKKFLALLLVLLVITPTSAFALIPPNTDVPDAVIRIESTNNNAQDQAEMLVKLGLFFGTDKGLELDREMTMVEAAVMIVRFLGEESEVLSKTFKHPFTDVPKWADNYIGWLYQNKMISGVSKTEFGSKQPVTYEQYATLLSRACFGHDNFLWEIGTESELKHFRQNGGFNRAGVVSLTTRALSCLYWREETLDLFIPADTIAQRLVNKGVFTPEQLLDAGANIFSIYHTGDTAKIAGVEVLKSSLKNIFGNTDYPYTDLPYFYVWVNGESETILYKMDCLTLNETEVGRFPIAEGDRFIHVDYIATVDGKDYIRIVKYEASLLVCVDEDEVETLAEGDWVGPCVLRYEKPLVRDDNCFIIFVGDTVYAVSKYGVSSYTQTPDTTVVGLTDEIVVLYRKEKDHGVVEGVKISNWELTDSYNIALPNQEHIAATISQHEDGIYGEGGYYKAYGDHLVQVTKRPTTAIGELRISDAVLPVVVSRTPDTYGNMIVVIDREHHMLSDEDELVVLDNDPPHGIYIEGIVSGTGLDITFYTLSKSGMGNVSSFTYKLVYNEEEGHRGILAVTYKPSRSYMLEHDIEWYVEKEQERLNELGYNPN